MDNRTVETEENENIKTMSSNNPVTKETKSTERHDSDDDDCSSSSRTSMSPTILIPGCDDALKRKVERPENPIAHYLSTTAHLCSYSEDEQSANNNDEEDDDAQDNSATPPKPTRISSNALFPNTLANNNNKRKRSSSCDSSNSDEENYIWSFTASIDNANTTPTAKKCFVTPDRSAKTQRKSIDNELFPSRQQHQQQHVIVPDSPGSCFSRFKFKSKISKIE